jgi:hypothetical protein
MNMAMDLNQSNTTQSLELKSANASSLVDPGTTSLLTSQLVKLRSYHEPPFVAHSVRRSQSVTEHSDDVELKTAPTLRQSLVTRLAALTYEATVPAQSSGVARHIRHIGSYQVADSSSQARESRKQTLQALSSSVNNTSDLYSL